MAGRSESPHLRPACPFLRGPGSPCWWPGPALWGGMQLHSDIPVAAQTQWHFVKSWATPSPCECLLVLLWQPNTLPLWSPLPACSVSSITNTSIVGLLRSLLCCQGTESLQSEDQNIFPCLVLKRDCLEGLERSEACEADLLGKGYHGTDTTAPWVW